MAKSGTLCNVLVTINALIGSKMVHAHRNVVVTSGNGIRSYRCGMNGGKAEGVFIIVRECSTLRSCRQLERVLLSSLPEEAVRVGSDNRCVVNVKMIVGPFITVDILLTEHGARGCLQCWINRRGIEVCTRLLVV